MLQRIYCAVLIHGLYMYSSYVINKSFYGGRDRGIEIICFVSPTNQYYSRISPTTPRGKMFKLCGPDRSAKLLRGLFGLQNVTFLALSFASLLLNRARLVYLADQIEKHFTDVDFHFGGCFHECTITQKSKNNKN